MGTDLYKEGTVGKWTILNRGRRGSYEPHLPLKIYTTREKRYLTTVTFLSVLFYFYKEEAKLNGGLLIYLYAPHT